LEKSPCEIAGSSAFQVALQVGASKKNVAPDKVKVTATAGGSISNVNYDTSSGQVTANVKAPDPGGKSGKKNFQVQVSVAGGPSTSIFFTATGK
jgi:hypothetical protein